MEKNVIQELLINLGDALNGYIFPSLRGVTVGMRKRGVRIVFYYDKNMGDNEKDAISSVENELLSLGYLFDVLDFKEGSIEEKIYIENYYYYLEELKAEEVSSPLKLDDKKLDYWVYVRNETGIFSEYNANKVIVRNEVNLDNEIYLILQSCLLGLIIPSIRFINFEYNITMKIIYIRIIYDGVLGLFEDKIKSELERRVYEIIHDFDIKIVNIRYDYPQFDLDYSDLIAMNLKTIYSRSEEFI
jgi:hypothetical protein